MDDLVDGGVLEGVVDGFLAAVVAVVRGGGVARVDGEEFALDEGFQVVDVFDGGYLGRAVWLKGGALDDPLVEALYLDVQAGIGVLAGDDAVNGRVCETCTVVDGGEAVWRCVFALFDEAGQGVGGVDGVFTGNDGDWDRVGASVNGLANDWSDELENSGADGTGYLD